MRKVRSPHSSSQQQLVVEEVRKLRKKICVYMFGEKKSPHLDFSRLEIGCLAVSPGKARSATPSGVRAGPHHSIGSCRHFMFRTNICTQMFLSRKVWWTQLAHLQSPDSLRCTPLERHLWSMLSVICDLDILHVSQYI